MQRTTLSTGRLHLQGFGAKLLGGPSVRNARVGAAFRADGESLAARILAGMHLAPQAPSVWR